MTTTSRSWRLGRSALFAVIAGLVALAGHVLGGGHAPDMAALITVTALIGGALSGFAAKPRGLAMLFGVNVLAQAGFHLTFLTSSHLSHEVPLDTARMLTFHLLAAAVISLVQAGAENAVFGLFRALHRVLLRALQPLRVEDLRGWVMLVLIREPAGHSVDRGTGTPRRGPPALLSA